MEHRDFPILFESSVLTPDASLFDQAEDHLKTLGTGYDDIERALVKIQSAASDNAQIRAVITLVHANGILNASGTGEPASALGHALDSIGQQLVHLRRSGDEPVESFDSIWIDPRDTSSHS